MSTSKPTRRSFSGYASQVSQKTSTPGVYLRNGYYIVLVRPDGKHKVRHRFETYEDAVAFKAMTPSRPRPRLGKPRSLSTTLSMAYLRHDPCAYCGGESEAIDHIVARSVGGEDDWVNFTATCRECNSRKGGKSLLLFLAYQRGCWQWHQAT